MNMRAICVTVFLGAIAAPVIADVTSTPANRPMPTVALMEVLERLYR